MRDQLDRHDPCGLRTIWVVVALKLGALGMPAAAAQATPTPAAADTPAPPAQSPAPPAAATPKPLCLVGGQVVDPQRRSISKADVLIRAGAIDKVAPNAGERCPGEVIDVRGQYVLPGLIDMHVHGWGNPSPAENGAGEDEPDNEAVLAAVLKAGVMATLDLAGNDQGRIATRDRLRGSPEHAALFVGTAIMARPAGAGKTGTDEDALRERVRSRARLRPDVIKIISAGGPVVPLIEEARKLGLKTVVHIASWDHAREALRAGPDAITHFEDEAVIPADVLEAWAHKPRTWSIPTMVVQCEMARLAASPAALTDPLLVALTTPGLRAAYRDQAHYKERTRTWIRWQTDGCVPHDFVSLQKLHRRGIGLLAGSDTGNLGTFQGYSLHRELELMVEAGIPAWEALQAATSHAANFLGLRWGFTPGAPANLLVLAGSPLADISNTRRIVQVIHRGWRIPGRPR